MDVTKEPMVLSLPAMGDRYALFPLLDGWTNVFQSPGKRTTGTGAQTYAITGPRWKGRLPAGMTQYKSATAIVWMIGRVYCTGTKADVAAAHAVEDGIKLVPLHAFGKPYTPSPGRVDPAVDMKTGPGQQVNEMTGVAFFTLFASLLKENPPLHGDDAIVRKLAQIGIVPGQDFHPDKLDPLVRKAMDGASQPAIAEMRAHLPKAGKLVNGWSVITNLGRYGTNYLLRSMVSLIGLGANLAEDAVYPASAAPFDGTKPYVMHFARGGLPPVNAFWSMTLYNSKQFFYANELDKYTVSTRDHFHYNADGSLDISIQHRNPGAAKQANWLPAPAAKFNLIMRLYWPKETPPSIVDGTWEPPPVVPAQ